MTWCSFWVGRLLTRGGCHGHAEWARATRLGTAGCQEPQVVRRLTSSFPLGKVTSLITPIQSEWTETHTNMLFCTDMYPATVLKFSRKARMCGQALPHMRALRENRCRGVAAGPAAAAITAAHCPAGNYGRRRCGVGGAGTCASARGVGGRDAASGPAATTAVSTTAPVGADAWETSGQEPFPAAPSPAPALRGNAAPQQGFCGAAAAAPESP